MKWAFAIGVIFLWYVVPAIFSASVEADYDRLQHGLNSSMKERGASRDRGYNR